MTQSDEARARGLFQRFNEIDCDPVDSRVHYTSRADDKMAALTAAFAEVRRGQWIPCGERMPEGKARPLLVAVKDGVEMFTDVWEWTPSMGPLSSFHKHIVYWQEVPELPEPPDQPGAERTGGT